MTNGLLKKLGNATKSMFVAGALASLLPNNSKAVPTEWSSIADIIAQAPEGESINYTSSNSSILPNRLTGILYVISPVSGVGNPVGGFDMQNGVVTTGYINRDSATRWGLLDGDTANTSENPGNTYDIFWQIFYDANNDGNFGLQENGVFYDRNEQLFDDYSISTSPYGTNPGSFTFSTEQIPEPSILGLLATGLGAAACRRRRKTSRDSKS